MHGTRLPQGRGPQGDHQFDHDTWIHGLMAAALGRGGPEAEAALSLRAAVDEAVAAIPLALVRAARAAARTRGGPLSASFRAHGLDVTATFAAERERVWVDATVGGHHVRLSVEPMGRSGRTGVVQGIDAPSGVARDVLATLARGWDAFLGPSAPSPSVKDDSHIRSTLSGSTASMHPR